MHQKPTPGPKRNARGHPTAAHVAPMNLRDDVGIAWLAKKKDERKALDLSRGIDSQGPRKKITTDASLRRTTSSFGSAGRQSEGYRPNPQPTNRRGPGKKFRTFSAFDDWHNRGR